MLLDPNLIHTLLEYRCPIKVTALSLLSLPLPNSDAPDINFSMYTKQGEKIGLHMQIYVVLQFEVNEFWTHLSFYQWMWKIRTARIMCNCFSYGQ